jgi:riboflavin synthase
VICQFRKSDETRRRLDGHLVQGHVDQTGTLQKPLKKLTEVGILLLNMTALNNITIEKGSITVNGVSLTVVNSKKTI